MRQLNFKKGLYKYYSPYLFKLYRLRAKFDLWRWGIDGELVNQLAEIYWCHFIRKKMSLEAKFFNCEPLPNEAIFKKQNDIAYILGCGASINEVTGEEWKKIDEHFSIGLNLFYAHEFTPSLYLTEFMDCPELWGFVHDNAVTRDVKKAFRLCITASHIAQCPENCIGVTDQDVYFYPKVTAKIKSKPLLRKLLAKYYTGNMKQTVLMHHRSNLDSAINYCVNLGYKDIRLVGIDLNKNKYFFQDHPLEQYAQVNDVLSAIEKFNRYKHIKQTSHATADPAIAQEQGCYTIDEYLPFIQEEVLDALGVTLSVVNPNSLLAQDLNVCSI